MKWKSLLAVVLTLSISTGTLSNSRVDQKRRVRLQALRASTSSHIHLTLLERAFLDAVAILETQNTCSDFFGGSKSARVLDELVVTLETSGTDFRIAVRMSGPFVIYKTDNGVLYRLFDKAELNWSGAFYRAKVFPSDAPVPNVGSFQPNTRQARVLILLHELAHLIESDTGAWLIPDDGRSPELSRSNTRTIESKCKQVIRASTKDF
jgi:hypothetical protein